MLKFENHVWVSNVEMRAYQRVCFQYFPGQRKDHVRQMHLRACSGFGLCRRNTLSEIPPTSNWQKRSWTLELWKAKIPRLSSQVWCANMTRKKTIHFNVSHANSFMVSHWFVLQDAIKRKRTAFKYWNFLSMSVRVTAPCWLFIGFGLERLIGQF